MRVIKSFAAPFVAVSVAAILDLFRLLCADSVNQNTMDVSICLHGDRIYHLTSRSMRWP